MRHVKKMIELSMGLIGTVSGAGASLINSAVNKDPMLYVAAGAVVVVGATFLIFWGREE
jgi:hypothetical protein